MKAKDTKPHRRKRSKTALLKGKPLLRALRCLREAEQTLTASTQLLDTLEQRAALTGIVADLETLQRRLSDLIEFRGINGSGRKQIKKAGALFFQGDDSATEAIIKRAKLGTLKKRRKD